jgi:phosphoglycolate phosphatase
MLIVFDLDGTLIDSSKDLALAMNATREHLGMPPIAPELVYSFVGNGVRVLVQRALGSEASEELVDRGHRFFISHYGTHATDNTHLYPGVDDVLARLSAKHQLAILTNKPEQISQNIAKALGIATYFRKIYGGDRFETKKPDPVGLLAIMHDLETNAAQTLMIGDSTVDIQTARNASVKSCGVMWGFQPDSLKNSSPDWLIRRPAEVLECVEWYESH